MTLGNSGKVLFVVGLVLFAMGETVIATSIIIIAALMVGMPLVVKTKEGEKKESERQKHQDDD